MMRLNKAVLYSLLVGVLLGVSAGCIAAIPHAVTSVVQIKVNFYDLQAPDLNTLAAQIRQLGPKEPSGRRVTGSARYQLRWLFDLKQAPGQCLVKGGEVITEIQVTLPNWEESDAVSQQEQRLWQRYLEASGEYEEQHKWIVLDAAAQIAKSFDNLSRNDSCAQLRQQADAIGYRQLHLAAQKMRVFRERSERGAKLGLSWPVTGS
ncbi:DUF922 domain-containing protein [Dongshaea marina]|uniref:DUF922 domain-containing protein n=1 Tax=Dongshaea marina TaxID=2047966 RepID=UPI000D3EAF0A|nr:DUF922 domain-containing protein [Dongshaea marina]